MSYPDRNNPYDFDAFLGLRDRIDYYADDPFIQAVLKTYAETGGKKWTGLPGNSRPGSPFGGETWPTSLRGLRRGLI